MNHDEIEILLQETMHLARDPKLRRDFLWQSEEDCSVEPGLLYQVNKNAGTFSLKGVVCENLQEKKEAFEKGYWGRDLFSMEQPLHFFVTGYKELAEIILDQMFHRRFPLHEEFLYNLGDPSPHWWLVHDENSLEIFFKNRGMDSLGSRKENLGPLGDSAFARNFLQKIVWPQQENETLKFLCTDRSIRLQAQGTELEIFKTFKDIFLTGNGVDEFLEKFEKPDAILSLYLREISALRKFWLTLGPALGNFN